VGLAFRIFKSLRSGSMCKSWHLVAGLVITTLFSTVRAQYVQQGPKLVGSGALGNAGQIPLKPTQSVALSSDGNTAIVGGPFDNDFVGAAWVFTRSGGIWSPQGSKLIGTGAIGSAEQGASVALSADGNTAIVGGL